MITEIENDGVAHVALISRNNDQLAEELLKRQEQEIQELYYSGITPGDQAVVIPQMEEEEIMAETETAVETGEQMEE